MRHINKARLSIDFTIESHDSLEDFWKAMGMTSDAPTDQGKLI